MDALKQQLLRIQQQLAGLSASQKMLTASLVAIMVMTLFYWSRYSGTAELVPLIDQTLSADDMAQVKGSLQAKGVKFELQGDKIMVSPDAKFGVLADLGYDQSLPRDMKSAFDEMIDKMTPLDSGSKSEQFYNHAREQTLRAMISRWPGVKSATVMINGVQKTSIFKPVDPSATVDITLTSGEQPTQKLADAARSCVSGAQSGLDPKKVNVLINGQAVDVTDPDNALAAGENYILKNQSAWENHYVEYITKQMPYIQGLYANVSVMMKTDTTDSESKTIDPKQKVQVAKHEITGSEDNTQGQSGGEPGVVPNTGTAPSDSPGTAQNSHKENTETEYATDTGYARETKHAPPGSAVAVRASVRVPESYFARAWKVRHPSANRDATDAEIEEVVQQQSKHIRDAVKAATNIKDDDAISVASYIDVETSPPVEPTAAVLATMPMNVGFGAKEIAIGALAVISLFMVSMMVRKSAPQPQLAGAGMAPISLGSAMDVIPAPVTEIASEVSESGAMMTGHELSEEAIEAKNVIEQVDAMVKANPDAAANLIKRWMNAV